MAQSSTTMTVRLDAKTRRGLEALARTTSRSKAFLAQEAIRAWVEQNEWQIAAIEEGIRSADGGPLVPQEDVESWLKSWGGKREKEPAR